jgi:hypothetical protein
MSRNARRLFGLMLATTAVGCAQEVQDTIMKGNANEVVISYYGDLSKTEALARQYCARYERVPTFLTSNENNAYYFCVPPGGGTLKSS